MDVEEALSRFQAGELEESLQEWHLLVTPEACDALGKVEVQRQSVIFEIIKSERDYVADLEAVEHVCCSSSLLSDTPATEKQLQGFH